MRTLRKNGEHKFFFASSISPKLLNIYSCLCWFVPWNRYHQLILLRLRGLCLQSTPLELRNGTGWNGVIASSSDQNEDGRTVLASERADEEKEKVEATTVGVGPLSPPAKSVVACTPTICNLYSSSGLNFLFVFGFFSFSFFFFPIFIQFSLWTKMPHSGCRKNNASSPLSKTNLGIYTLI